MSIDLDPSTDAVRRAMHDHIKRYHEEEFDNDYDRIKANMEELRKKREMEKFMEGQVEVEQDVSDACAAQPSLLDFDSLEFLERHKELDFRLLLAIQHIIAAPRFGQGIRKELGMAIEYIERFLQTEGYNESWDRLRDFGRHV
jgi:hypothetical protein